MEKWINGDIETWRHGDMVTSNRKQKTEAQAIFPNLFTICSSCKQRFVVCLFFDVETNGSYPFANGINRLNRLAHLWVGGSGKHCKC
jgi:hypothetical protein